MTKPSCPTLYQRPSSKTTIAARKPTTSGERGRPISFASASFALHQCLATVYRDWHLRPRASRRVVGVLLAATQAKLSPAQQAQGWEILCNYWERLSTPSLLAAAFGRGREVQGWR